MAPKPIQTLVISAVILPSARSRETLGETGRLSSNNLCAPIVQGTTEPTSREQQDKTSDETETMRPALSESNLALFGIVGVPPSG
jgi:hypothetical protein